MNCREAERLCHNYLDREITVAESTELWRHLRDCARCGENWLALRRAVDLLAALPDEHPGPSLLSHVMMRLPRPRSRFYLKLNAWQTAAAVLFVAAVTSLGFFISPQLAATAVENGEGRAIVVPRPGRTFVIPAGAIVDGDLIVQGDVYLHGQVRGKIRATGRITGDETPPEGGGIWARLVEALTQVWEALTGKR